VTQYRVNGIDFLDRYITFEELGLGIGVWTWGDNSSGQLGQNIAIATDRSSPVQVGTGADWKYISCGSSHALVTKSNGTLWSWGLNSTGQLGQNDTVNRSSPIQIGTSTDWKYPLAGEASSFAIKTDGTLWVWGDAAFAGVLGLGNTTDRSSPVQLGTNTYSFAVVKNHSLFLRTDNTLWSCGFNDRGQLGHNDTVDKNSPVQIGADTNWTNKIDVGIYQSFAIKDNGTLWTWGSNTQGSLGQNDTIPRSSPVQIGTGVNWEYITSAETTVLAIKTDGTLWGWGQNGTGELGLNDTIARSSPVQIGTDKNWAYVDIGPTFNTVISLKTDGTLWTWGANAQGQLGSNSTVARSSPVQVGTLTSWKDVKVGNQFVIVSQHDPY